ncbi:MAG TPA: Gfo/Idh/MocA family oxidoreductase [Pirellulales bacterium]
MSMSVSRREFLRRAVAAGVAVPTASAFVSQPNVARALAPNEKLKIGVIGVANRAAANLSGVSGEEITALCDVDTAKLDKAAAQFPNAKKFTDFRKLLEGQYDAVVVSTPDHTHFHPAYYALNSGFDVYCEKPLAHSVWEVRKLREAAKAKNRVTQMGTQIHAEDNYRRVVEIVRSGVLGPITDVHVWLSGGMRVFNEAPVTEVPKTVDYDLWTGPAPLNPFSTAHFDFNWRYWFDYGNGALGDFGCHYMDLPHWALDLSNPTSIKTEGEKGHNGVNDMPLHLKVEYKHPAKGDRPPVTVTWYQGKYRPDEFKEYGDGKGSAVLFEGTKGRLLADYGSRKAFMDDGSQPMVPQSIPNSIGHHAEFLKAVRDRGTTTCNFEYSGALAETVLLGNVSYRAGNVLLEWDDAKATVTNEPKAAQFLKREYRKGWEVNA